ncbi:PHB depolymerase family esterase [Micromonospora lupini]|uniref:Esterase (Cellulose-binding domain) n=1 Tax=Micromonospora lupini str. Lupac 08 TaxID=1150864 RepID=I0L658_9ACTN|nr:PHB depolymerase family esterase [Micromonospora lupini]CCH19305.1 Esterase (Cellulose-binding domain) [Micromonospora lupini str. Lupac 08]
MTLKTRMVGVVTAVVTLAAAALAFATPASAATLTQVTGFGTNPTNLQMHLYVPDRVASRPAILLALHYCTGSGPAFHSGTQYASLADRYGFIVIYPSVTRSSKCWDVASPQALRRGGGSDPVGLMSMVDYVKQRYSADPDRVFATGTSSGAMMTNVMLGDYPDVFAAGASFAGVPFACFATGGASEWNSECANGQLIKTAQQWGDLVRGAYPGYTGRRPRMQIWHGTSDETLRYPNFGEQIKQWTNVHGLSQTPTYTDSPQSGYTRTRYGSSGPMAPVEAISMQGVTHNLPVDAAQVIRFFGLDGTTPPPTTPPPTTPPPTTPPPTTPPPTTPPPTTPPPTTPPPTTPPPGSGDCAATVTVNQWTGGFVANVRVTAGSSALNGWTVTIALPSGATVTNAWSATNRGSTGTTTWTNVSYNGQVGAGQSTEFGFQGTGTAGSLSPTCAAG